MLIRKEYNLYNHMAIDYSRYLLVFLCLAILLIMAPNINKYCLKMSAELCIYSPAAVSVGCCVCAGRVTVFSGEIEGYREC